jgi:protein O-mannosyl-transferase
LISNLSVRGKFWSAVIILAIAGVIIVVFLQTRNCEFVFDDEGYVLNNGEIARGLTLKGVAWALTSFYFSNWHPVTWISHMLDIQLFGLNPGAHRLVNVFLHLLASAFLFLSLRSLTGTLWRSAAVAALFAIHPLHVESVAWVTERKDVLSGVFLTLGIGLYLRYARKPSSGRYVLVLIFFALGLMTKAILVTYPLCLLLLDWWPLRRIPGQHLSWPSIRDLIREKIPLLFMSITVGVITYLAQQSGGAVQTLALYPFKMRLTNAVMSYASYLLKMVWPVGLAVYYPHPGDTLSVVKVSLAAALLTIISFVVFSRASDRPYLTVGWLWYFVTLAPVIGIVQVGAQAMADRYTYLPSIGLFIMAVWLTDYFTGRSPMKAAQAAFSGVLVVAILVGVSRRQVSYWRNSETLYRHALKVTSRNWLIYNNLGKVLERSSDLEGAVRAYRKAISIYPDFEEAVLNLAKVLEKSGHRRVALLLMQEYVGKHPQSADAQAMTGELLMHAGRIYDAVDKLSEGVRLKPGAVTSRLNLAELLSAAGRRAEAQGQLLEALRLQPDSPLIHRDLGILLMRTGEPDKALAHFEEALRLAPEWSNLHYNYAVALERLGRISEAVRHYRESLRLDPDYPQARKGLERVTMKGDASVLPK